MRRAARCPVCGRKSRGHGWVSDDGRALQTDCICQNEKRPKLDKWSIRTVLWGIDE